MKLCCFTKESQEEFCWPCWKALASTWDESYLEEEA